MSFTLNEPLVDALMERLDSDLPAAIDQVNSVITDEFPIDQPFEVLDYVPPVREMVNFPTVCIVDGGTTFEDDTAWSATGVHRLVVVAFLEDLNQRALTKKLRRYQQALATCLLRDRNLPPEGWGLVLEKIEPGPTLGKRRGPETRMSWVALSFRVMKDEMSDNQ